MGKRHASQYANFGLHVDVFAQCNFFSMGISLSNCIAPCLPSFRGFCGEVFSLYACRFLVSRFAGISLEAVEQQIKQHVAGFVRDIVYYYTEFVDEYSFAFTLGLVYEPLFFKITFAGHNLGFKVMLRR